ncbi:MAG: insulinase family protein [Bacteroidales bacterium]|nr:insulinase family protein [Bacteroidales bacterium]
MLLSHHTLSNGIRLVHHRTNGIVAHCGLIINTGSRDENAGQHGMAHFIEHMLFKGTRNRKPYHIFSRLDDAGGELNAYTTKEETAVYASVLKDDFEKAADLISDIAFNSIFPEKEIGKEKEVIIEEINSFLDNPAELIFDEFEEMIFPGQPIGRNILGTPETVKSFTQKTLNKFIAKNYSTNQMVFCSVGNIPDEKILYVFEKYFGSIPGKEGNPRNGKKGIYKSIIVIKEKDTYQNHCIIGNVAYGLKHKQRIGLFLLNNILGGPGLTSRLNMSLRERNGLAYSVESGYNAYCDTGVFSIYFGTEKQNLEKSTAIIMSELNKLRNVKLGIFQLSRAKNQIKGYLARGYENYENLMLSLGKSMLVFNKIDTPEEIYKKIDNLSSSQILDVANEIFEPTELSTLVYK